jgi:hypothetical protein
MLGHFTGAWSIGLSPTDPRAPPRPRASADRRLLQIIEGVGRIAYDLPAKLATYFAQGTCVGISKNYDIFWLKGYDEICVITPERHQPLRLVFPNVCIAHARRV